jgi:hypothetical protein
MHFYWFPGKTVKSWPLHYASPQVPQLPGKVHSHPRFSGGCSSPKHALTLPNHISDCCFWFGIILPKINPSHSL